MAALLETLRDLSLLNSFYILVLGSTRALGALFGLWGLYYVLGTATVLRIVVALTLSAPMMLGQVDAYVTLIEQTNRFLLLVIPLREFAIGFGLGLLMSLPFFAILGAAMLVDQYRGDFSPGLQGPEGLTIGSYANLNVVMTIFLFVEAGGFLVLIRILYESYGVLPPAVPGLGLPSGFGEGLGDILQNIMLTLAFFAMPVILILMLIELGLNLINRMSEQIKMPSIDFLVKNLALTLLMPLLVYVLIRMIQGAIDGAPDPLPLALRLLNP